MSDKNDCDITVVLGVLVVFALPLTLLVPGFSVWDVVPKIRISRLHVISQDLTWPQLNAIVVSLLILFFCLYLEIRKRKIQKESELLSSNLGILYKCINGLSQSNRQRHNISRLDDMVEKVLTVSQATDVTMEVERERQAAAVRVCVELLDASAEHYENLVLLRDELRKREKLKRQCPPEIEPSSTM